MLWLRAAAIVGAVGAVLAACGSRTGLLGGEEPEGPSLDASIDAGPLFEGGPLDVQIDCPDPAYCNPADPGRIYRCGVPVFQCSSLEQCEERGESGAECVNPCRDTLGQNTSNGCEFFAVEMDTTDEVAGACFAVFVVNQWKTGEPAKIEVSRGGKVLPVQQFARIPVGKGTGITYAPFDANKGVEKDQVAVLFLSRDPAADGDPNPTDPRALARCPPGVVPAVVGDAALHGTGKGEAFRIKTNVPVVAYQMLPYGAGRARVTGASLLLPTNVWDGNYVTANAYAAPTMIGEDRAGPTMVVIGQNDGTHVTIRPSARIVAGGGLPGTPRGVPITYSVDRGQYLQFTQPAELTGSVVEADAPVAVIGGSTLMDLPLDVRRADGAHQMLPPVRALGSEYVAVRYRGRRDRGDEVVPWRIVGVVDGTQLTFDPPQPGAPQAIGRGQLAEFDASGPFVVRSQDAAHPFYVAQYMTGGQAFSSGVNEDPRDGEGDPEFVNVIAPAQYLPRYTFFTDPTYPETNLVIVRVRDAATGAFPDVVLDCAGPIGGFAAVGGNGQYEFARVDLSTGDFEGQNGCDNGVHTIEATLASGGDARIGVTVWGWGNPITYPPTDDETNPKYTRWVSYGYPAGADIKQLNDVIVPAR